MSGKGIVYFNDGSRAMGDYCNDKPVGKYVRLYPNGSIKYREFDNKK